MTATRPHFYLNVHATRRSALQVDRWLATAVESDGNKPARARGSPPKNFRPRATPGDGILPELKVALEACEAAYFITLTTKRRYDPIALSGELKATLRRANKMLFGTAFKRRQEVALVTYAIQERSESDGLHVHLVVGVPEGSLGIKLNPPSQSVPQLIISAWVDRDPQFRRRAAQDAQAADYLPGVFGYVEKRVRNLRAVDSVDFENCHIS